MSLLDVRNLTLEIPTDRGLLTAVDNVSFSVEPGSVVGIVGESGSGKSVTCNALVRLVPRGARIRGSVIFDGRDILQATTRELQAIRGGHIGYIFQDPMTNLNPSLTVGRQISETIIRHRGVTKKAARQRTIELLDMVGIPAAAKRADLYPHEFSGGMRQRILIAMALSCDPKLLIADEPTTALDVTIQAQILDLLREMQKRFGMSIILVTHDFGVVADICDHVAVFYGGEIVEQSPVDPVFSRPRHPYTKSLLGATERLPEKPLVMIPGMPPPLGEWPTGCRFAPRCSSQFDACAVHPELVGKVDDAVRCHLFGEG